MNHELLNGNRLRDRYASEPRLFLHKIPDALNIEPTSALPLLIGSFDILRKRKTRRSPRVHSAAVRYTELLDRALTRLIESDKELLVDKGRIGLLVLMLVIADKLSNPIERV